MRLLDEARKRLAESGAKAVSMTDPEARRMKTPSGAKTALNVRAAVDNRSRIVVGMRVSQDANDRGQLGVIPISRRSAQTTSKGYGLKRDWIVEAVFGQSKENRGVRRFKLRGLIGACSESALQFLAHNLLKAVAAQPNPA